MTRAEKAKELFLQGYNCAQATFGAFCEDYGLDFNVAMALSAGLGGGIGRLRETCGAVTGATLAVSLAMGSFDLNNPDAKTRVYSEIRKVVEIFESETGTIVCADMLGVNRRGDDANAEPRTPEYYKKRPCAELVYLAADAADKIISELQ
ncbi:MAG: C_GCAxxG_C_C family protein [Clostridia bacterium]|nr:C_GCAxxG_C_C family protein [Clostridia bacterium]